MQDDEVLLMDRLHTTAEGTITCEIGPSQYVCTPRSTLEANIAAPRLPEDRDILLDVWNYLYG